MSTEREPDPGLDVDEALAEGSSLSTWIVLGTALLLVGGLGFFALADRGPEATAETELRELAASFKTVDGNVKVKTAGEVRWGDAETAAALRESDLVRTGVRSTADIEFVDTTEVSVRPESLITIQSPEGATGREARESSSAMTITSGEISFQRQLDQGRAEVSTPTLRSTISERARANIRVESGGDSDIRLFAGRGRVETSAGETVELEENQGLRVDAEGRAGPKVALPGTPALVAPADAAELGAPIPPRDPLRASWAAVAAASDYRVQVASDSSFGDLVFDGRSGGATALSLPRLELGDYHWRVSALGEDDAEGEFSASRRFRVVTPPSGPALRVDSFDPRGNIAQIQGQTVPGARLTVDGVEVPVQVDGSFDEFVTLSGGGDTVVVRSVGPGGGVSESRHRRQR
jgi:hypothetical protein